jgi:hypothetical protein
VDERDYLSREGEGRLLGSDWEIRRSHDKYIGWVYNQWKESYHIYSGVQKSSDPGEKYVTETQRVSEIQQIGVDKSMTQSL